MLILSADDVRRAVSPALAFDAVRDAFLRLSRDQIGTFPRHQLSAGPRRALMGVMPVADLSEDGSWAMKVVLVGPDNRSHGLDSHQGFVMLADGRTGQPLAMIDATSVTALRTAAASAVATVALANPDPTRIAILGGGTQARSHVAALRSLYPSAVFTLWARSNASALAAELALFKADTVREATLGADIVCTVTGAYEPILAVRDICPGTHVNAVGASRPTAREIAGDLVAASRLILDSAAQAETECGELLLARSEGAVAADHAGTQLQDVIAGHAPGRGAATDITLFKSLGIAAQDLAVGQAALASARALGLGTEVDL
ncbi:ornithine cyclodeaminase family protein [Psychromarinibacter halotolerans]|uniref:Ornithine cyclodeaminase family protein n=1 Tax=Psychromarinibacter halotolerans TaxID=1775175 RepID=A0ABV7GUX4_9RHOB|nr:ornithine cyclodeaminase family protein [Psychromarinibacter halotolerans]MDF0595221.1 ornithine cyclodeaminase family protein [Psychromarinibacter halotolerans]